MWRAVSDDEAEDDEEVACMRVLMVSDHGQVGEA
jgi:hypothetical protein